LAIHGERRRDDGDFLMLPKLTATDLMCRPVAISSSACRAPVAAMGTASTD
jgi:hypothetical protein